MHIVSQSSQELDSHDQRCNPSFSMMSNALMLFEIHNARKSKLRKKLHRTIVLYPLICLHDAASSACPLQNWACPYNLSVTASWDVQLAKLSPYSRSQGCAALSLQKDPPLTSVIFVSAKWPQPDWRGTKIYSRFHIFSDRGWTIYFISIPVQKVISPKADFLPHQGCIQSIHSAHLLQMM